MFIATDGFEVYKTLFTNISLESNLQLKEVKKLPFFYIQRINLTNISKYLH